MHNVLKPPMLKPKPSIVGYVYPCIESKKWNRNKTVIVVVYIKTIVNNKKCLRTFTKPWNRAHYLPTVKFTSTRMTTIFMSKLAKRNSEMTKTTFTIYLANNQSG